MERNEEDAHFLARHMCRLCLSLKEASQRHGHNLSLWWHHLFFASPRYLACTTAVQQYQCKHQSMEDDKGVIRACLANLVSSARGSISHMYRRRSECKGTVYIVHNYCKKNTHALYTAISMSTITVEMIATNLSRTKKGRAKYFFYLTPLFFVHRHPWNQVICWLTHQSRCLSDTTFLTTEHE
jgi:hypothetical protein